MLTAIDERGSVRGSMEKEAAPAFKAKRQTSGLNNKGRGISKLTSYGYQGKRRNLRDHTITRSQSMVGRQSSCASLAFE